MPQHKYNFKVPASPQKKPHLSLVASQSEAQRRLLEKNKQAAYELLLAIKITLAQSPR